MEHKRVHWKTQDAQENLDPPIQNHKQQRVMSTFFYCVSTCNNTFAYHPREGNAMKYVQRQHQTVFDV